MTPQHAHRQADRIADVSCMAAHHSVCIPQRYSFIVVDFPLPLSAGFDQRTEHLVWLQGPGDRAG
jgi:hypothetical protein